MVDSLYPDLAQYESADDKYVEIVDSFTHKKGK